MNAAATKPTGGGGAVKPLLVTIQLDISPALMRLATMLADALAGRLDPPLPGLSIDGVVRKGDMDVPSAPPAPIADSAAAPVEPSPAPAPIAPESQPIPRELIRSPRRQDVDQETAEASAPGRRWTPERDAIVTRGYPAGRALDALRGEINAMPGPPVNNKLIGIRAAFLGVKRSGVAAPPAAPAPTPPPPMPTPPMPPPPMPTPPPPIYRQAPIALAPAANKPPADPGTPIFADQATIRGWAGQRGLATAHDPLDLAVINRKRIEFGLPPFALHGAARTASPGAAHA